MMNPRENRLGKKIAPEKGPMDGIPKGEHSISEDRDVRKKLQSDAE